MGLKKIILLVVALFACSLYMEPAASASDGDSGPGVDEPDFGIWQYCLVSWKFHPKFTAMMYFEHRSRNFCEDFDYGIIMPSLAYWPVDWVRIGAEYEFAMRPTHWSFSALPNVTFYWRPGNFEFAFRELLVITTGVGGEYNRNSELYDPSLSRNTFCLRHRLRIKYTIPSVGIAPYVSGEYFMDPHYMCARVYAGLQWSVSELSTIDFHYIYHPFANRPDSHLLGLGYALSF